MEAKDIWTVSLSTLAFALSVWNFFRTTDHARRQYGSGQADKIRAWLITSIRLIQKRVMLGTQFAPADVLAELNALTHEHALVIFEGTLIFARSDLIDDKMTASSQEPILDELSALQSMLAEDVLEQIDQARFKHSGEDYLIGVRRLLKVAVLRRKEL